VQSVLAPEINLATIRVLARNGVEVIVPRGQGCCGALAGHMGRHHDAQGFARRTLGAFPTAVDAVLTNAAGCGSMFKDYAHLMEGEAEAEQARAFAARAMDVSKFLFDLGLSAPVPALEKPMRVAYHDACHLGHAQNVRAEPRQLLGEIPGAQVVELPEAEICCGSAGVYNITQPEMARDLLKRKVGNIVATGAGLVATGNIGCLTQIRAGLPEGVRAMHTFEVLDQAYAGTLGG
jgi:glycolate oxidase iron-sulfur subunit